LKALITGAGGFLGSAVAVRLLEKGANVCGLARSSYPKIESKGVVMFQGDLANFDATLKAAAGCDIVFHIAAKAGVWGSYQEYYKSNVIGTENVIRACREHGVKKLVYTSTPSITYSGTEEDGIDESAPYAAKFLCHYPATKAEAEKMVLAANGEDLATVALRPHLIWGPGDNNLTPRIIDRGIKGKLRLVGDGSRMVDSVYIDNAALAHILAAEKLDINAQCAGKAYFISNDEPLPMGTLVNKILDAAGLPPVKKKIPVALAYAVGAMSEVVYKILNRKDEPMITRFVARQLSTSHWFNITAAKRDLDYSPTISIDQGMALLKKSLA